jgi:hypothetical protein
LNKHKTVDFIISVCYNRIAPKWVQTPEISCLKGGFHMSKSWDEDDLYRGETPPCPRCGTSLTKKYIYSGVDMG